MALNRYARLRKHKRHLKQRHANAYGRWNIADDEAKSHDDNEYAIAHFSTRYTDPRNNGYKYWENRYMSGRRKYAKSCSNKRIRAKYRQLALKHLRDEYLEVVVAPQGSEYEKEFDYAWTIY